MRKEFEKAMQDYKRYVSYVVCHPDTWEQILVECDNPNCPPGTAGPFTYGNYPVAYILRSIDVEPGRFICF